MIRVWAFQLLFCTLLFAQQGPFVNHLEGETSPYLQQHLHNPVDWYPWGEAAFEKAKREHKPIFLSIGFSTCHWCHVMAEESFEDPDIAAMLNRWFVAVKVDREAMPDIDSHFQTLYRQMHGRSGGWPLTVLLTEEGAPFFTGTYIPPTDAYGIEGMLTLLPRVGKGYSRDSAPFKNKAARIAQQEPVESDSAAAAELPDTQIMAQKALKGLAADFDADYKGFGTRPKFPPSARIQLLFDIYKLSGAAESKNMALQTLDAMARSGLYDQIEGGFFRYSTDRAWTQPHFEKMLYTNAQLISAYAAGWKAAKKPLYEKVVRETIAEMAKRFQTKEGLWFAASSSDSETGEGGYYLYDYDEADAALTNAGVKASERRTLLRYFGIEKEGGFDGEVSHVHLASIPPPKGAERARSVLKSLRKSRRFPFIDKKIITAWNAMMVSALFDASAMDARFVPMARRSYAALRTLMAYGKTQLYHQTLYGHTPKQPGLLEDYAYMVQAALKGYETTLDSAYLHDAEHWAKAAVSRFYEQGQWRLGTGGYSAYDDGSDKYYTSPMALMLRNLLELEVLESDLSFARPVLETFRQNISKLLEAPEGAPALTAAYLRYRKGIVAIKQRHEALQKHFRQIAEIDYPFLVQKAEPGLDRWIACDARSCFGMAKRFEGIKKRIEMQTTTAP